MKINHLAVVVSDLTRAEAFYAGVLGLSVIARHADAAGRPRAVWLGMGGKAAAGAFLALELATEPKAGHRSDGAPGWHCIAFAIGAGERQTWRTRLTAAGVPVERESDFTLYVRDPDGALVGLSHHPEPR